MYFQNTDFIFYDPNPFCTYIRKQHICLKIRAKRVGTITNKMCIFTIRETYFFIKHMPKMSCTQIKAFLCFELKGGGLRSQNCFYLGTLTFFSYAFAVAVRNSFWKCTKEILHQKGFQDYRGWLKYLNQIKGIII